jgi:dihydropteroate synthase-like protein
MARYLFITGKLAAQSLRATLEKLPPEFEYEITILPISVAALMDTGFVNKHLADANGCDRIYVPGLCKGDLLPIAHRLGVEVVRGPKSLKDLPSYLGAAAGREEYGAYQTKIIAEIVDAYQLSLEDILARAAYYRASGADIIDLGCPVAEGFPDIGRAVSALKQAGYLVSVDSFNPEDILNADAAGVDFVLSVNSQNMQIARRLHCRVVVIPDFDKGIESLEKNFRQLEDWGIPYILDPILNPICFGFTQSLEGFIAMRRKYPKAEMLLGLGNLTELTAADTTGTTAVMAGIVAELGIDYVLTTEVISWARGAVRELDIARRLMHYACRNQVLPKHLDDSLVTVKDPPFENYSEEELRAMQAKVRDRNFRIFADRNSIYVFNNRLFIKDTNIQLIFDQLKIEAPTQAFYLGRELQKASMAVRLGKRYVQEEELQWGYLSRERGSRDS